MMGLLVASSMQMLLKIEDCNYYKSLPCRLARCSATFVTIHEILSSDGAFVTVWVEQIVVVLLQGASCQNEEKCAVHWFLNNGNEAQ